MRQKLLFYSFFADFQELKLYFLNRTVRIYFQSGNRQIRTQIFELLLENVKNIRGIQKG